MAGGKTIKTRFAESGFTSLKAPASSYPATPAFVEFFVLFSIPKERHRISNCNSLFHMTKKGGYLLPTVVTLHRRLNLRIMGYRQKERIF
jgi:hypothetical protein